MKSSHCINVYDSMKTYETYFVNTFYWSTKCGFLVQSVVALSKLSNITSDDRNVLYFNRMIKKLQLFTVT